MNVLARKRLTALILACLTLLTSCPALAETLMVLEPAAVYASPQSDSPLGELPAGAQLERVAEQNGWSMIQLGGNTGFMRSDALAEVRSVRMTAYAREDAAIYESFSASSRQVGTIPSGESVAIGALAGDWACVQYGNTTGFVQIARLSPDAPADNGGQPTSMTAYASVDGAKVYSAPGVVAGTVPVNTEVTVRAIQDGVCLVERGGVQAFMLLGELSAARVEAPAESQPENDITTIAPTTFYVCVEGAKVFDGSGRVIAHLGLNTPLTVSAYNDKLALVSNGSAQALMYRTDLSPEPVKAPDNGITTITPTTFYVRNDGAKVYNGSGKAIGQLPLNTAVSVSAYNDQLALIECNGNQGLMYRSDLSESAVEVPQAPGNGITVIQPTTFYVRNDGAKVYDASGREICSLPKNFALTVSAYNDSHALVSCGDQQGLMLRGDLAQEPEKEETPSDDITEITPTTFYVCNDGAQVLAADGSQLATLKLNTAVIVDAYTSTLARVRNGSTIGFMQKSDLSTEKTDDATGFVLEYGAQGEAVKKLQSRLQELGYFYGTIGGNYLDLTRAAVMAFQTTAKLTVSGVADEATLALLFSDNAPKAPEPEKPSDGISTVQPATGTAVTMDWWKSDIQSIFARGTVATITDVETGIAWREKRTGGTNHADVQPLTAADTAAMKKTVGSWTWDRRAIFVTINGVNYAASMNVMPHGSGSITTNNFSGHHCIHFTNSRTHGSNKICSLHQAAIRKAAQATL